MSFFNKIFKKTTEDTEQPDIKFGRFSDSYKEDHKYDAWDSSLEKFEEDKFLESFDLFLDYLKDDEEANVKHEKLDDQIKFEIFQGSKKISGFANKEKVKAEAKIAETNALKIGFLRRLVELNFGLKYSRYALDKEDNITMLFDTYMLDGSPYKMYYALKELAINADKQDDILLSEFDVLKPINTGHVKGVPREIKEIKYRFFNNTLDNAKRVLEQTKLKLDQYPGAVSYLLLDSVYRLDYLIKPEGYTMDLFERIHKDFFRTDNKSAQYKNKEILKSLTSIRKRTREQFMSEMYGVKATFGITAPTTHDRLVSFIDGELSNMNWYLENKYEDFAQAIPGYIVGHCLFNYALPAPDKELLHLYYMIMYQDYFVELGFSLKLRNAKKGLNRNSILNNIDMISRKHRKKYPKLVPNKKKLKFDSVIKFSRSYLLMIKELDLSKSKK